MPQPDILENKQLSQLDSSQYDLFIL